MWRRAVQVGGLVMAILSLVSYLLVEAKPAKRSYAAPNFATTNGEAPTINIAIAGRDIEYCKPGYGPIGLKAEPCKGVKRYGRTDTMMFVRIQPGRVDVISIPRDTAYIDETRRFDDPYRTGKMNSVFTRGGYEAVSAAGITDYERTEAEAPFREGGSSFFKRQVEALLGVSVDYTVVFNVELVGKVIDALGGIDVYLPEPMQYTDRAANLYIDLPAGNQHLNGEQAVGYLRFRRGYGSDYARMDRAKAVIGKLMQKLKSPAALGLIPTLIGALRDDIVTNANTLELTQQLLPHIRNLTPRFYTLPTLEDPRFGSYLQPDTLKIQALTQSIDNPTAINLETAPKFAPTIVDQSGVPNLGRALAAYFVRSGWGKPEVIDLEPSSEPTQVIRRQLGDAESAEFYANVLGASLFTPYRYPDAAGDIAIVLGKDAGRKYGALAAEASRLRKP